MSQPQDPTKLCFLDLPAEVRNSIYEVFLVARKPLSVDKQDRVGLMPDLLAVCTTIKAEATAILYGSNTIQAQAWQLTPWLEQHRAPSRYICHIKVEPPRMGITHMVGLCARLKEAVMLQRLELPGYYEDKRGWDDTQKIEMVSADRLAMKLRPLAKALKKNRKKANDETRPLYDVVTFYAEFEKKTRAPWRSKMVALMTTLTADVRAELKAFMDEEGLSVVPA